MKIMLVMSNDYVFETVLIYELIRPYISSYLRKYDQFSWV